MIASGWKTYFSRKPLLIEGHFVDSCLQASVGALNESRAPDLNLQCLYHLCDDVNAAFK